MKKFFSKKICPTNAPYCNYDFSISGLPMDLEDGEIEELANQASTIASTKLSSFRRLRGGGSSGFNDYSRTAPIRANNLAVLKHASRTSLISVTNS